MSYFDNCLMDIDFLLQTGGIVDCQNLEEEYNTLSDRTALVILLSLTVLSMAFPKIIGEKLENPENHDTDGTDETEETQDVTASTHVSNTRTSRISIRNHDNDMQRLMLLSTRIQGLLIVSILSIVSFFLVTFSIPTLTFFAISVISMSLAGRAAYQEIQIQIDQNGILYYLPQSLQDLLTSTTIHEYMSDSTFYMEHRYLLLYFIPGLTEQQLTNLIQQLPDHRRRFLLEQGQIAELLLPSFLRDRLYPLTPIIEQIEEEEEEFNLTTRRNNNIDDLQIPSDLVWTNDHNTQIQNNETVSTSISTTSLPPNLNLQTTSNDNSNPIIPTNAPTDRPTPNHNSSVSIGNSNTGATSSNPDWDQDERVLNEAIQSVTNSFSNSISQSTLELANTIISPTLLQRSSRLMGFMTFSTIAQWSWSLSSAMGYHRTFLMLPSLVSGNRNNEDVNNVHVDVSIERNWLRVYRVNTLGRLLASSTIFMGLSTGLLYCMRSYIRRNMQIGRERREYERLSQQNTLNDDSGRVSLDSNDLGDSN